MTFSAVAATAFGHELVLIGSARTKTTGPFEDWAPYEAYVGTDLFKEAAGFWGGMGQAARGLAVGGVRALSGGVQGASLAGYGALTGAVNRVRATPGAVGARLAGFGQRAQAAGTAQGQQWTNRGLQQGQSWHTRIAGPAASRNTGTGSAPPPAHAPSMPPARTSTPTQAAPPLAGAFTPPPQSGVQPAAGGPRTRGPSFGPSGATPTQVVALGQPSQPPVAESGGSVAPAVAALYRGVMAGGLPRPAPLPRNPRPATTPIYG